MANRIRTADVSIFPVVSARLAHNNDSRASNQQNIEASTECYQ